MGPAEQLPQRCIKAALRVCVVHPFWLMRGGVWGRRVVGSGGGGIVGEGLGPSGVLSAAVVAVVVWMIGKEQGDE